MKAPRETDLVNACLTLLKLRGIYSWRQNMSGIKRRDRAGREFWAAPGMRGVSDILALLPGGRLFAIETKSATGKLTAEQQAFQDAVNHAGGYAVVVRDVSDLVSILNDL